MAECLTRVITSPVKGGKTSRKAWGRTMKVGIDRGQAQAVAGLPLAAPDYRADGSPTVSIRVRASAGPAST
jgi:hypothetical protein